MMDDQVLAWLRCLCGFGACVASVFVWLRCLCGFGACVASMTLNVSWHVMDGQLKTHDVTEEKGRKAVNLWHHDTCKPLPLSECPMNCSRRGVCIKVGLEGELRGGGLRQGGAGEEGGGVSALRGGLRREGGVAA